MYGDDLPAFKQQQNSDLPLKKKEKGYDSIKKKGQKGSDPAKHFHHFDYQEKSKKGKRPAKKDSDNVSVKSGRSAKSNRSAVSKPKPLIKEAVPLKKDDNQHPKVRKYKEMLENMKKKPMRSETTYGSSYIPPIAAEFEQNLQRSERARTAEKRSKTYDLQKSVSPQPPKKITETEYRDEFWNHPNSSIPKKDKAYTKEYPDGDSATKYREDFTDPKKRQAQATNKSVSKNLKNGVTEYRDEFMKGKVSSIQKRDRRLTREWENGLGETEYRKDYTDPGWRTDKKPKEVRLGDQEGRTTYGAAYISPERQKEEVEGRVEYEKGNLISIDMGTEYRTEYLGSGKKGVRPGYRRDLDQNWKKEEGKSKSKSVKYEKMPESESERGDAVKPETPKKKSKNIKRRNSDDNKKVIKYTRREPKHDSEQQVKARPYNPINDYASPQHGPTTITGGMPITTGSRGQKTKKHRRNLQESVQKEPPQQSADIQPKNLNRNLDISKENPIDNWAYMSWQPSDVQQAPDMAKAHFNEIGMSYAVSKHNVGMTTSPINDTVRGALEKITNTEDRKQREYKDYLAHEKSRRTERKIDARPYEKKFAGYAGLPAANHNRNMNYIMGEPQPQHKLTPNLRNPHSENQSSDPTNHQEYTEPDNSQYQDPQSQSQDLPLTGYRESESTGQRPR